MLSTEFINPINEEKWIQKAIKHKGGLHKSLHVPADKPIPAGKLEKATHSSNPKIKKQAVLAKTLKSLHQEDAVMCPKCKCEPCRCDEDYQSIGVGGMGGGGVIGEKAPPGMEAMVLKLKKEYPGHPEKAFATAWSIYNKKHKKK